MIEAATGVRILFKFGGTMESTEAVLTGKTTADAAWFANAKYLLSDRAGHARVKGGRVFDARRTPLYAVFKDIRAYQ